MNRLYVYLGLFLLALFGGAYLAHRLAKVDKLEASLKTSEEYRDAERLSAQSRAATMDAYTKRIKAEASRAADARADLARVLNAPRPPSPEASATCGLERARIAQLDDLLREGAQLVEEGGRHVEQLRNDRQALSEVVK